MPTRLFDQLDMTVAQQTWITGPNATGNVSADLDGSAIAFSGNISGFANAQKMAGINTSAVNSGQFRVTGAINFLNFPAIPENATINSVRIQCSATINSSVTNSSNGSNTLDQRVWLEQGGVVDETIVETDQGGSGPGLSFSGSESIDVTVPLGGITRAQLIIDWTNVFIHLGGPVASMNVQGTTAVGSPNGSTVAVATSGTFSGYSITVDYTSAEASWYIKPTEKIVNGEPTIIIETGDIIELEPDEDVPEGFELYGTVEEFPDGPIFIWWTNPNVYQFWIFSPITPGPDWTEFGGIPVCSECLTLTLGELTILIANASGIYYLQPDKRNDTLYSRDALGEQIGTVNVKISNPRGTTGLVP